jgi:hypothetical protein
VRQKAANAESAKESRKTVLAAAIGFPVAAYTGAKIGRTPSR